MRKKGKHSILFVCLGNICRSPAAEGILRQMAEQQGVAQMMDIDSAGIGGWHVGQLPDSRMRRHGMKHGYDFCSRARQVETADFERFDMIVAMDDDNYANLMRMAPTIAHQKKICKMAAFFRHHPNCNDVPDPYYDGDQGFEDVIELLEDACSELLAQLCANE